MTRPIRSSTAFGSHPYSGASSRIRPFTYGESTSSPPFEPAPDFARRARFVAMGRYYDTRRRLVSTQGVPIGAPDVFDESRSTQALSLPLGAPGVLGFSGKMVREDRIELSTRGFSVRMEDPRNGWKTRFFAPSATIVRQGEEKVLDPLAHCPDSARLMDMNNAQIKGLRLTAADYGMGAAYEATRITITKTDEGYEVRKGGKLLGVTLTSAGARELAGAL